MLFFLSSLELKIGTAFKKKHRLFTANSKKSVYIFLLPVEEELMYYSRNAAALCFVSVIIAT